MKEGWEEKRLGDVCDFVRGPFGGSLKKNCFKPDGYAVYEQQHAIYDQFDDIRYFIDVNKFEEMKRFELFPGDLIMSCSGTMGKVAIVPNNIKRGIINQALLKLTPKKTLNVEYLSYWMDSDSFQESIAKHSLGAAIKNVASVKNLKEIEIPIPPLSEQKQIVAKLDEAFGAIDVAKANIEKNIENARELFQSRLNEIFSWKGDGWEEKRLGDVCNFVRGPFGGSLKKNCFKLDGYAVYEQQHAIYHQFDQIRYFIDEEKFEEMKRFELFPGDLIMSCSGTMGKVSIVPNKIKRGIINQALLKLTPTKNLNVEYLSYWMNSESFQKSIAKNSLGAAIKNVASVKILKEIQIPVPSLSGQKEIVAKLDEFITYCKESEEKYSQKLTNLEELKKSLLQKAFAGELT